jgi:hypothetical protein
VTLLLRKGARFNTRKPTELVQACVTGYRDVVQAFLTHMTVKGIDIAATLAAVGGDDDDDEALSPLMAAIHLRSGGITTSQERCVAIDD